MCGPIGYQSGRFYGGANAAEHHGANGGSSVNDTASHILDPTRVLDMFGLDPLADSARGPKGPPKPKAPPPPVDETKILFREMARAQTEEQLRARSSTRTAPAAGGTK
jgi:hypothetical protein